MVVAAENIRSFAGLVLGAAAGALACAASTHSLDCIALGAVAGGAGTLAFSAAASAVRDLWSFRG